MVRRTQDLHIFDEDYDDYSQKVIADIKEDYKYDDNKEIPFVIFCEEKNKIDSQIYKTLMIITIPAYLITGVLKIDEISNAFIALCYFALVLLVSHLTAGVLLLMISAIFSGLIQKIIVPKIIKNKYK